MNISALMKLFIFLSLFSYSLWAKPEPYMVCLGAEEFDIHKYKIGGAHFKLNRELISALLQLRNSIKIKEKYSTIICSSPSPSVKALELIMSTNIFYSTKSEDDVIARKIDDSTIKELKEKTVKLFLNFIHDIQAEMPSARCLFEIIPELEIFFDKMRYFLEDVGLKGIMQSLKSPSSTFLKLSTINLNKPDCKDNK